MAEFTKANIVDAMQACMRAGVRFQAKDITKAGLQAVIKDAPQHPLYSHPSLGSYEKGGYFAGEPLSRIADKLLQQNRKQGKIVYRDGFWSYVGR